MKDNSVLFISPTPTHPANAGNRQHIKSLVSFFKEQNWEVHFLYLAHEDYDEEAMHSFFGNNLHIISKQDIYQSRKTVAYVYKKFSGTIFRLIRKFQYYLGSINKNQFVYNSEVDNYFSIFVKPVIKELQQKYYFNAVVCEYAFISKSLTFFDRDVFKILDTHDRFTDRFQTYFNTKSKPKWVSLFKGQERKALKRADLILAVHQTDAAYFSKLSRKKTSIFNYIPAGISLPQKLPGKKLLYIASANDSNLLTINLFIENTFPIILQKHTDTILIIGGSICEKLEVQHSNIIIKGRLENLDTFYSLGDIVINPEIAGTGYKIKAMEALSYGMPFVATTTGASGVAIPFKDHLFIADTPQEFAEVIDRLFCNSDLLRQTSLNARNWIINYKEEISKRLISMISA
jgi:glycosyltransferase involved in cell wall biosynthesis